MCNSVNNIACNINNTGLLWTCAYPCMWKWFWMVITQPVTSQLWIYRYYLLAKTSGKPYRVNITALALDLSFVAWQQHPTLTGGQHSRRDPRGLRCLESVWQHGDGAQVTLACLAVEEGWGWASRAQRTLSLKIHFFTDSDSLLSTFTAMKSSKMQSFCLPKVFCCAPCQNAALASYASIFSTQAFFGQKKSNFGEQALCPVAQKGKAGEGPYPMETAGGTVSLLAGRDN